MNNCDEWLDRMPGLAAGSRDLTPEFSAHLEGCAECRANWQVIQAGARVGARAAATIDPERMARTVVARLADARAADQRRRYWTWGTLLAAAAALTLVVYTGKHDLTSHQAAQGQVQPVETQTASTTEFAVPVSGLEDLDDGQLQTLYDQLDGALSAQGSVGAPHLEELSPDEMEQVLNSLEG